mmetsp:Transcript_5934/g.6819  ORF Transcript_5934/g.6819 Transcript_5934/m.6819 type:complete len:243 (-) Transcript_5934:178-906(-)
MLISNASSEGTLFSFETVSFGSFLGGISTSERSFQPAVLYCLCLIVSYFVVRVFGHGAERLNPGNSKAGVQPAIHSVMKGDADKHTSSASNDSPKVVRWKPELVKTRTISSRQAQKKTLAVLVTGWRYSSHDVVEFKIEFRMDTEMFCTWKRYSDLRSYDSAVRSLLSVTEESSISPFPRKSTLNEYITGSDKDSSFLRARCKGIEEYLQSIMYSVEFSEDARFTIASYTRDFFVPQVTNEV